MKKIKTIELFAGVGGFRLGLEKVSNKFDFVWSNQWEPNKKKQIASEIYINKFGKSNHSNIDIAKVPTIEIPNFDLLVGGFPCQDYSVAKTLSKSQGITGKKGILWWEIYRIINEKKIKPKLLFLENVDRLLKSPAKQRGRDFAIMLASLSDLGYIVEWRVINAAEYGMPQKRKRVYILAYYKTSNIYKKIISTNNNDWIFKIGIFAKAFPIKNENNKLNNFSINNNLKKISKEFNKNIIKSPFENSGIIINREVFTYKVFPNYTGKKIVLKDILIPENKVPLEFFIDLNTIEKWNYLKNAKNISKISKDGHKYKYIEGKMTFPDDINKPSRTIVTGEGGPSPSRFKHVIKTESGKLRRLTPIELERLNMFPDNYTKGGTNIQRAFLMGNALVVGVIEKIGKELLIELD